MEEKNALAMIFERNYFYRRQYLLALSAFGLSLLTIIALIFILIHLIYHPTRPIYFATDNVSRLIHIIPVDRPNIPTDQVLDWSVEAVQNARSFDFMNYRAQLQNAQKYFTIYGWHTYFTAFTAANNIPGVVADRSIILAKVVGEPKVVGEGLLSGAYAWKIQMPLLVTTWKPPYSDTSKFSNGFIATIIVQRQPVLQSYDGLGILQYFEQTPAAPTQPQEISGTSTG